MANCFYPISIQKNPILKGRNVPCGRCPACRQKERNAWSFRVQQEQWSSDSSLFITLTYSDEYLPKNSRGLATLDKRQLINYIKRIRKYQPKVRYFAVGEYGGKTKRPHYHAVLFNVNRELAIEKWSNDGNPIGHTFCVHGNDATIHYVTKYLVGDDLLYNRNTFKENNQQTPFRIMSKGLGKAYVNEKTIKYHNDSKQIYTLAKGGSKVPLPRWIRQKIFTEDQLKILNELARRKAQEQEQEKTTEQKKLERIALKYKCKQRSKSN